MEPEPVPEPNRTGTGTRARAETGQMPAGCQPDSSWIREAADPTGKQRFQPGAGNWHRSEPEPVEPEPVEPERETEPEIWKFWKSGNPEILEIPEIWKSTEF